ncbi:pre-rRNA-processing protein TSR1 homolog [Trifolium pratense]|uniref:pre-rRNA-processing protein TSR1 homolog n=1 Tax=Trifolium pratense TaxID=57577 RepID=UPI001E69465E|nr:pre-rRNA-processing protein TSR1 homolog [Trifolium pratense]XP_045813188.1 pre-rRNA-processing protein TSR1 homolog [Trifolium pratense]XP_045813189.1 pre-rRNA-processing protein TSR1 homolog [Trifolium pratense]XP_045813190.1 pre-rRNA-processing protein TSR1 homolog [Trifolium pratense]
MAPTHQVNKSHKSRFSSKSSRNIHKTSVKDRLAIVKSDRNVGKGARAARLQRNKMIREQKRATVLKQRRELSGSKCPPRLIVLFALCATVDLESLADDLLSLLSKQSSAVLSGTVSSSEYRTRVTVLKAPHGDLLSCMEMAKVADLLVFVASTRSLCEETDSYFIDSFGNQCLSVFRSIGLPSTAVFVRDLPTEVKQRNELKKICTSSLASEFPEDCKFYPADTKDDLHKFLSLFKEQRLKTPHWRTQRSYLVANKVDAVYDGNSDKCTLVLSGYLRVRNLSVNQLVHVSGAGDFQLCKIEVLKDPFPLNSKKNQDLMDSDEMQDVEVIRTLVPDADNQESLVVENKPDLLAGEQTWPTEEEIKKAAEDRKQKKIRKRKLPAGTSEYQAAWITNESDEEVSDSDNEDGMVLDEGDESPGQEGNEYLDLDGDGASLRLGDSEDETDNESMMEVDTREKIEDELKELKEAHAADVEYPDEVDTPLDVPARVRFAKYRGLKSFRNSSWDPKESLPQDYAKIFAFDQKNAKFFAYDNFKRIQKHVLAKALELDEEGREDCIPVGSYARLHIKDVPSAAASKLCTLAKTAPVTACGLLKHESKLSVLHFSVKKHETYDAPIKAKEELIFHVGFRQFVGRPTFSSEFINTDKNKMERFLHAGRFSVASIYAPISFPPLPTIVLKRVGEDATVAAVGSLKTVDPARIILKRVILTGYPQKVSKRKASVRHMFYNPEDVKWFKPVEIYTKRGLRGRIKEPVGTHGATKCLLNGVLEQCDTVCLNLYKRAYPKRPTRYFPLL